MSDNVSTTVVSTSGGQPQTEAHQKIVAFMKSKNHDNYHLEKIKHCESRLTDVRKLLQHFQSKQESFSLEVVYKLLIEQSKIVNDIASYKYCIEYPDYSGEFFDKLNSYNAMGDKALRY